MAKLIGFRKTKSEATNILDVVEKSYLNRTQYGEFNTVEEVDGLVNVLKGLPQTLDVQERIAGLENKKLQISAKLGDLLMEKGVFDTDLNEALTNATKNNLSNPKQIIGSYAAIYGDAAERYETEVFSKIFKRYGTANTIPQEVLDYRKQLNDKAKLYGSVFNSYNFIDPDTNEIGMLNPEGFGIVVDTNPATGRISRMELVPSGEIKRDAYMRTDTPLQMIPGAPAKKIPTWIRTFDGGMSDFGKPIRSAVLGEFIYSGVDTAGKKDDLGGLVLGQLKIQKEEEGILRRLGRIPVPKWFGWEERMFGREPELTVDTMRNDGVNLKNFQFDSTDVPDGSVLQMGGRLFYSTDKKDEVFEIGGKDKNETLRRYLQSVGKDPNSANVPYFVDRNYFAAPDGSSRIKGTIDDKFFNPPAPSIPPAIESPRAPVEISPEPVVEEPAGFFAQRTNRLNVPEESRETIGGLPSASDIVEKGKSFFRKFVPTLPQ